ncbi:MAG TPA: response regulator [Desulfobacterales bacterium]|nr:response regulator [Desulfobacterales bacterium]
MIFMPGISKKESIAVKQNEKRIDILIVDDQPYIPDLLSVELTQDGYLVKRAGNAEAMWEYLRDMQPDLLLLDHYLNGTESWDVLLDINRRRPEIPVLIYVIKHFDALYRLKQTISEVLSLKRNVLKEWGKINLIKDCA